MHDNAFTAHVALKVVEDLKGDRDAFIKTLFKHRDLFINSATEEISMLEVRKRFAHVAVEEKFFDHLGMFVGYLKDWPGATDKAWQEQKDAIALNITQSPTHLIGGKIAGDDSINWDLAQWTSFISSS